MVWMNVISGPGVRGAEAAGRRRQETGWIATLPHVRGEAKTGRGEGGQSERVGRKESEGKGMRIPCHLLVVLMNSCERVVPLILYSGDYPIHV